MGEGGKSFFLVEIMPVLKYAAEKRRKTGRHARPRYKGTETGIYRNLEGVTAAGTWPGKWRP